MADPATPSSTVTPQRFDFAFDPLYRMAAMPFGVTPKRAWVQVDSEHLEVRYGFWQVRTPLTNVVSTEISGPYQRFKTIGPAHLSFADKGLTFASNGARGVCIGFAEPVKGIDPVGNLRHPGLTVTVSDPEALVRFLGKVTPARSEPEKLADVQTALDDLHTMTAAELRDLADEHGVARTSSMSKANLVAALEEGLGADLLDELEDRGGL